MCMCEVHGGSLCGHTPKYLLRYHSNTLQPLSNMQHLLQSMNLHSIEMLGDMEWEISRHVFIVWLYLTTWCRPVRQMRGVQTTLNLLTLHLKPFKQTQRNTSQTHYRRSGMHSFKELWTMYRDLGNYILETKINSNPADEISPLARWARLGQTGVLRDRSVYIYPTY